MDINKFMFELNETLYENSFYNIQLYYKYNEYNETYLIRIIAKRDNSELYNRVYTVDKNWLDSITIDNILTSLIGV